MYLLDIVLALQLLPEMHCMLSNYYKYLYFQYAYSKLCLYNEVIAAIIIFQKHLVGR